MTESTSVSERSTLTEGQKVRLHIAAQHAREAAGRDPADARPAELVLTVRRLTASLDDVLRIIGEITDPS